MFEYVNIDFKQCLIQRSGKNLRNTWFGQQGNPKYVTQVRENVNIYLIDNQKYQKNQFSSL